MNNESQEVQRYGRNKETLINKTYINGGTYRKKFDNISNNKELNRLVYQYAKLMLLHRSGTLFEDMYWIDTDSVKIVASEIESKKIQGIIYSKNTKKIIAQHDNLLAMHTHPNSMPPSVDDFNSALKNKYQICIVCCHDGKIFMYQSFEPINIISYKFTIAKYRKLGYNEYEAQLKTLLQYQEKGAISFKEV